MLRITHKYDECIGCDFCVEVAPNYFYINEDGIAALHCRNRMDERFEYGDGFDDDYDDLKNAEIGCPTQIIKID